MTKVKRLFADFEYWAASQDKPRRVVGKIEWPSGDLYPKLGFIVTNMPMEPDWVARFYNQRGTAEQHIKEGKYAFRWTRCRAGSSTITRCGCNCMPWPTTQPPSCASSRCPCR